MRSILWVPDRGPRYSRKEPRYTGPSGSGGPSGVNRRLSFKLEEEDKEAKEEEEDDHMDYEKEIPDTQDEDTTFIRTWETANLLSIAQLGDIYLRTRKLTPKQAEGVTDLLAAIDKVFDLDLCIQTIDDKGKATSDVRKAVARMKSGMMKEAWLEVLEATRKAAVRKHERQTTSMMGKLNHTSHTSNNNTSRTSAWSISTTMPSPTSLKTELYLGKHLPEAYLFFLADTRLPWLLR